MVAFKHRRVVLAALFLAAAFYLTQIVLRPLWRDEFWTLLCASPHLPLSQAVMDHMSKDVHPPGYFIVLHYWLQIWDNDFFARIFNLICLVAAGFAAWSLRGKRRDETLLYLFLVATSYWLVFYNVEVRMLGPLMLVSGLLVLVARNILDFPEKFARYTLMFLALGLINASMHFFGALWVASLGLGIGVAFAMRQNWKGFVGIGVASALAISPILIWIALFRPDQGPSAPSEAPPFFEALSFGLNQFLRGVIVKTFLVNPAAFIAAALGAGLLFHRKQDPAPLALSVAVSLTVLIAFAIHLGWVAMIRERAFIVMIPGLLYLVSASILTITPDKQRAQKWASYIPAASLIFLPLQVTELFRDREQVGELRALMSTYPDCAQTTIIAYERVSPQDDDFAMFFTNRALSGVFDGTDPKLVSHNALDGDAPQLTKVAGCPIQVIAVGLERGERSAHEVMREELKAAGVPIASLEEVVMGGGRTRAFLTK